MKILYIYIDYNLLKHFYHLQLPSIDITQTHNRFKLLANTLLKKREMH
jgi:hypothetical protein